MSADGLLTRLERRPVPLGLTAIVVALGAATAMAAAAGFSRTGTAIEALAPEWLAVALLARVASYAGYTVAHHRVMSASEESEIELGTAARVVAFGAGATSLRGGFSIDARALRGAGVGRRGAAAHVAALAMFEYAVLAAAALAASVTLLGATNARRAAVVWPWVIGVPAGTLIAAALYVRFGERLRSSGALGGRVRSVVRGAEILAEQARRPWRALTATAGMALYWASEIVALWASLRAFGVHAPLAVVVVGFATGYVLTPRGLPLAGAGVAEVLLPLGLHWLGVALAPAIAAAFAAELTRLLVSIPFSVEAQGEVAELVEDL